MHIRQGYLALGIRTPADPLPSVEFWVEPRDSGHVLCLLAAGRGIDVPISDQDALALRDSLDERWIRVRLTDEDEATLTLKGKRVGISCPEHEYRIARADAEALYHDHSVYGQLEKTRFLVANADVLIEVDRYHGPLEGRFTAEVELKREDQPFEKPSWLGREVSGDKRYDNATLARHGWPADE